MLEYDRQFHQTHTVISRQDNNHVAVELCFYVETPLGNTKVPQVPVSPWKTFCQVLYYLICHISNAESKNPKSAGRISWDTHTYRLSVGISNDTGGIITLLSPFPLNLLYFFRTYIEIQLKARVNKGIFCIQFEKCQTKD